MDKNRPKIAKNLKKSVVTFQLELFGMKIQIFPEIRGIGISQSDF